MKKTEIVLKIVAFLSAVIMALSFCSCIEEDDTSGSVSGNGESTTLDEMSNVTSDEGESTTLPENSDETSSTQDSPEAPAPKEFSISRFEYYDKNLLDQYQLPLIDISPVKCTEDGILMLECNNKTDTTYVFRDLYSVFECTTTDKNWVRLTNSNYEISETTMPHSTVTVISVDLNPFFPNGVKAGEYKIELDFPVPNGHISLTLEMAITFTLGRPCETANLPEGIDMTPTTSGVDYKRTAYSGGESMKYDYYSIKMKEGFDKDTLIVPEMTEEYTVTAIDGSGFVKSKLKFVLMNDSMRYIAPQAFKDCKDLETVIFGRDVWKIDDAVFALCTSLKNVYLNEGLFYIAQAAFYGCTSLEEINMPSTVRAIHDSAFAECENLKEINYNGTVEEWQAVKKFGTWISSPVTVHCLDGDVVEEVPAANS